MGREGKQSNQNSTLVFQVAGRQTVLLLQGADEPRVPEKGQREQGLPEPRKRGGVKVKGRQDIAY